MAISPHILRLLALTERLLGPSLLHPADLESEGSIAELLEHRSDTYYAFTAIVKAGLLETLSSEPGTGWAKTGDAVGRMRKVWEEQAGGCNPVAPAGCASPSGSPGAGPNPPPPRPPAQRTTSGPPSSPPTTHSRPSSPRPAPT